jgi:hypothetical protein
LRSPLSGIKGIKTEDKNITVNTSFSAPERKRRRRVSPPHQQAELERYAPPELISGGEGILERGFAPLKHPFYEESAILE